MTSVDRVKKICKARKIPISKLEKDLGFANGYIGQLRKGVFPDDRLVAIASYLDLSADYLLYGENEEKLATQGNELFEKFSKLSAKDQALVRSTMRLMIEQLLNAQSEQ